MVRSNKDLVSNKVVEKEEDEDQWEQPTPTTTPTTQTTTTTRTGESVQEQEDQWETPTGGIRGPQLSAQEVEEQEALKRAKIPLGNPKVTTAYERADMDYKPTNEEVREFRWKSKAYDDRRKSIDQIYRIKLGNNEWLLYNETNIARDKMGNKLTFSKLVGRYNYPEFNYRYDEESGTKVGTEKVGDRVVYEIPFTKSNLQKILDKDTEGTDPGLVLQSGSQKYAGYTIHEFMNRSFEELLVKGRTGSYPNNPTTTEEEQQQSQQNKRMVKEIKRGLVKIEGEGEATKAANDFIISSGTGMVNNNSNANEEQ